MYLLLAKDENLGYDEDMDLMKLWGKRAFVVVGLLGLILLIMDFNSRMAELTRLRAQREIEAEQLVMMESTKAGLEAEIAYATSEPALEAWAREQGRYFLPGDYPIIPVVDPEYEAVPEVAATTEEEESTNLGSWLAWLFP